MPREEKKQEEAQEGNIAAGEAVVEIPAVPQTKTIEGWTPKTQLGKDVASGAIASIDRVFEEGKKIREPQIIDVLLPNLKNEIILVGGSTGKGGGIRRTPIRRTSRMHKSGRRYKVSSMVVVGNGNGYVGLGYDGGPIGKNKEMIQKALNKAKLGIIPIRRGCGSWECRCSSPHSIPFAVKGKTGSVEINLMPAPKGIGLCVSNELKKVMRLAGIKDIWCKSRGQTKTRTNMMQAIFTAFKKLNRYNIQEQDESMLGIKTGRVE